MKVQWQVISQSNFSFPEKQVLILMLDNHISPCRAEEFSEQIVMRLAGEIFRK